MQESARSCSDDAAFAQQHVSRRSAERANSRTSIRSYWETPTRIGRMFRRATYAPASAARSAGPRATRRRRDSSVCRARKAGSFERRAPPRAASVCASCRGVRRRVPRDATILRESDIGLATRADTLMSDLARGGSDRSAQRGPGWRTGVDYGHDHRSTRRRAARRDGGGANSSHERDPHGRDDRSRRVSDHGHSSPAPTR